MRKLHIGIATAAAAGLLSIAAFTVHAQGGPPAGPPGVHDPSKVTAGNYALDPNHSMVGWTVSHFGFSDYFGAMGGVNGSLQIDPANVGATKLDVNIPLAGVVTPTPGLTAHLLRDGKEGGKPDFFGSAPTPAHFVSTKVTKTGADSAKIDGDLTFNGVTKPVSLDAKLTGAGPNPFNKKETVGFTGSGVFKRSDFGFAFLVPMVSDEVRLDISVAFEKQ